MKKQLLAAAAALALCGAASAQTTSVVGFSLSPGFYQSTYSFSLAGLSNVAGDVDFLAGTQGVAVNLVSGSSSWFDSDAADGFSFTNLSGGNYQLLFTAFGSAAGAFGGSYTVTAVPEPATYGMMAAGLGLLGFMAARRRRQG